MSDTKLFEDRQREVNKLAARVLNFTSNVSIHDGMSPKQQAQAIVDAAIQDPMFESVNPDAVRQIALPWAAAIAGYRKQHGVNPPADMLANAYNACNNLILESAPGYKRSGAGAAMLESAVKDMATSQGVLKQAVFMAMILPAALGASTGDMCTFMPVTRDESDFYEIYNIAGSDLGSFKKGDRMDQMSTGIYSQMGRIYVLSGKPDGTEKEFTIRVKDKELKDMPIRPGRVRVIVGRVLAKAFDDGDGNINVNEEHPNGETYTISGKIDYAKGIVVLTFKDAPTADLELAIQAELDVENAPDIIPVVNQSMRKYTMKPSQYILAAEHSVQAMMELQREFGQDLASMQFTSLTQWTSHEIDMKRLRKLAYHTIYDYDFDIALPEGQVWESWCGLFKTRVNTISTDVRDRTLKYGIRGGYAGGDAAAFIKSLPSNLFAPAPNYVQTSYVHFIGTLFGTIRIYEVPSPVCAGMDKDGYPFSSNDILFYSRGDSLGEAGMVAGDAIPAIPFTHPTTPSLINRQTMWGSSINEVHPRNGYAYFARLTLTNHKEGALDPTTGKRIAKPEVKKLNGGDSEQFIAVDSITLSPKTKTVTVGEAFKLDPAFLPENATNQGFVLVSADSTIASIEIDGSGQAHAVGTVNITMTSEDGTLTAVTKVVVNAAK